MSAGLAWLILVFAGFMEVAWSIGLKYSQGFTRPVASVLTVIAMIVSMVLLAKATETLPLGTAYSVWVGIGSIGATIFGIWLFHEPATPLRILFLSLLVVAIVGLKAVSNE